MNSKFSMNKEYNLLCLVGFVWSLSNSFTTSYVLGTENTEGAMIVLLYASFVISSALPYALLIKLHSMITRAYTKQQQNNKVIFLFVIALNVIFGSTVMCFYPIMNMKDAGNTIPEMITSALAVISIIAHVITYPVLYIEYRNTNESEEI